MTFLFMKPKCRAEPVKKSEESQAIIDRMKEYLESAISDPIQFLETFWHDQAMVITYAELRKIATDEEFPEEIMEVWRQDYSKLIAEKITPAWEEAIIAGIESNPQLVGMEFDASVLVREWTVRRSAELVTNITQEQADAIRHIISEAVNNHMGSEEVARYIRPVIGLTEPQTAANLKFYNNFKEQLAKDHPRMKPESIERKARQAAARYASKQHRARAKTIARTELARAYAEGRDAAIREAIAKGLMPRMKKKIIMAMLVPDSRHCTPCRKLDGTTIDIDEYFTVQVGNRMIKELIPPLHPNCYCVVDYVEE